jgi:hypothetical protein
LSLPFGDLSLEILDKKKAAGKGASRTLDQP